MELVWGGLAGLLGFVKTTRECPDPLSEWLGGGGGGEERACFHLVVRPY